MKHTTQSRILSMLLALAMVFSMLPVSAFAAEGAATWTKVDLADITAEDTVTITMLGANAVNYGLVNSKSSSGGPAANVVTVSADGNTLTTPNASDYSWTITAVDGGYQISAGEYYLYSINSNNGIRVNSDTPGVWTLDGTYLKTTDTGGNARWLGVYYANNGTPVDSPNWRAYKNTTGNTAGQTVSFWKLAEVGEATKPEAENVWEPVSAIADGDTVVLLNPNSGKLLTSDASDYKLAGIDAAIYEEDVYCDDASAPWTVSVTDGVYSFTQGEMKLGMVPSGTYFNLTTDTATEGADFGWVLEESSETGVFFVKSSTLASDSYGPAYLEYWSGFTGYASNSPNVEAYGIRFYKLVDDGSDPTDPTPTDPAPTDPNPTDPEPTDPVTGITVADGDYVLFDPQTNKAAAALAESKTYGYIPAVDLYGSDAVWTITNVSDTQFTIQDCYGRYVYQTDDYNSFNVSATVPAEGHLWVAQDAGSGAIAVKNVATGKTVSYDTGYSSFGCYGDSKDTYHSALWAVAPKITVADGDYSILAGTYYASNLGADKTYGYLPQAESAGTTEVWTITNASYGEFTIQDALGRYLYQTGTFNSFNVSADLPAEGHLWTLTDAGDGKVSIVNVLKQKTLAHDSGYSSFGSYGADKLGDTHTTAVELVKNVAPVEPTGPVADGDMVVIYNPANMKALSSAYTGYYNSGTDVTLTGGVLSGYTAADIWVVGVNADGTYTFSTLDGRKIAMGTANTSMPLDEVNDAWSVTDAATDGCYYIKNVGRNNYMEWYADKGNWSSYYNIGSNEALFAQKFYKVTEIPEDNTSAAPEAGDEVVIYNLSAQGVLAQQNENVDSPSIEGVSATVTEGVATPGNGAVVFSVEVNGDYYRFWNETYGYLCSNGTGNNAFYSKTASEDADWTLSEGKAGGWFMESRTAKFNGQYSQYLEYYSDSYKTYSMYNVTDYDIYEFFFYGVAEDLNVNGGIVNQPKVDFGTLLDAYVGQDYTFRFTVDAVFGVDGELTVKAGEDTLTANEDGSYTIPAAKILGESLTVTVTGVDTKGIAISGSADIAVKDEPVIGAVAPEVNAETGENKRPVITAEIINAGQNATVTMTVNGEAVDAVYADGAVTYTPAADMADGTVSVTVTVTRADGKEATRTWRFTVGEAQYQFYFGQLHSHTTYSDGSGSLETALDYIASLPESANVDFVAFTDHSNYFDTSSSANPEGALYDMSLASADSQALWNEYKKTIADFNAEHSELIALAGFEMTWSGGPGHINTFNTAGIVSRNNSTLNNKTSDAGMRAYYALLSLAEGAQSISQFNHPGTTFGNFTDFAYWDALIDTRIQLVEVGNGEGAIGAGGYYPSYEQYTMALDKGWHVAPTNNQDNHKGKWGNANDARDVILTDEFTEEGVYAAIRAMRMYATEDKNLEIYYTVNDQLLGSIIEEEPETLVLNVQLRDPDATDSISKVEVIVNSGKVAYTWSNPAELATGELTVELAPEYTYYYIRVTEGDGDLAVTAPVWVGENLKLGISSAVSGTSTPVTGEELTISTTLFNSETTAATVKSLTYTTGGSVVIGTDTEGYEIPASGTTEVTFAYTPEVAKLMTVTVTAVVELEGTEYTFTKDIELDVQDASKLVYIGIDASHYNEYVAGNYKDSMGNFGALAAGYSVRTVELKTSEELIAACSNDKYKALILTAPSRRLAAAQTALLTYTDAEVEAIVAFNSAGGTVILAGWSDYYEYYPSVSSIAGMDASQHMAATQNALLEAMGSSLRITDDATNDDSLNGGQTQRLYFNAYNYDSFLVDGVEMDPENPNDRFYTEVYSQYGGATIHVVDASGNMTSDIPATVTPIVFGHTSTYSKDSDNDGIGGSSVPKYAYAQDDNRLMVLASEQLEGKGLIVVSGAAFMSNFEVQATIEDSGSEKNYSNYKICENLVQYLNPVTVTDIADVQAQTEVGFKYTIEGVVTSNASGYDKDTAFFDCIYVQDATGGICCFPVAGNYKIGDKVRVTGTTEFYQGEMELQVSSIEIIGEGTVEPTEVTAAQINDGSVIGQLITLTGKVVSFELANGLVQTIMVEDAEGNIARVFIDGYITTDADVQDLEVGGTVTVTGLASYDNTFNAPEGPFPRIRVRNRADVVCAPHTHDFVLQECNGLDMATMVCTICGHTEETKYSCPTAGYADLSVDAWYHASTDVVLEKGIMVGTGDNIFSPMGTVTRGQFVTILYRLAGEPEVTASAPFTDVAEGTYYADAVAWAYAVGVAAGISDTRFAPNEPVTREQLVAFLYRYAGSPEADASVLDGYTDAGTVHAYAVDAMSWAVANGIITGMTKSTLAPAGTAKRVQAAAVIHRFLLLAE